MKPSILLISRTPIHGPYLYKLLSRYYDVAWVGRKFPFKITLVNVFYILFSEFLELLFNFRRTRFSLILVQFVSLDGLVPLLFKRIFGAKIVLFAIGSDILKIHERGLVYPIIKEVIMKSDVIICASTLIEERVKRMGVVISKIAVFPPIVNFDGFEHRPYKKDYDIINVGSLDKNKNQMLLLNACKLLPRSFKALIIGDGYMRTILEKETKENNLNISFTGKISHKQVFDKLQRSRIYVHASKSEAGPLAAFEAMFCGLPVVLVESPYVYVLKHHYGFLFHIVDEDSAEDLAAKISEVSQNYENELRDAVLNKQIVTNLIVKIPEDIKKILDRTIQSNQIGWRRASEK